MTSIGGLLESFGAEQLVFGRDAETGMQAVVALHSTVLGPGLGGTRFFPYASEHDAIVDVLRLARGMTYKHAVCGNDLGGGKAVLIGDPRTARTPQLMRAYARFVDSIGGRYLTAEDVGTTQADMDLLRDITPYVTGTSEHRGGSGDPSPATAWGVLHAMHAVAHRLWGDRSLAGRTVAIVGTGKVGAALAWHLADAGAALVVADVDTQAVDGLAAALVAAGTDARVVPVATAYATECEILSPCALGAGLNERSIAGLRCAAVCGCANNQLEVAEDGQRLAAAGVLYVPDYVANAGGVMNIADELGPDPYDHDRAYRRITTIEDTVGRVLARADAEGVPTSAAADRIAEERIADAR